MKSLVVIVGPTAVGKTSLCIDLAEALGTEIISADSRQFFREMNIGTAKPTPGELSRARHHFIDSHSIHKPFNAGDFEREALALLERLFVKYNTLIMTGGSGLYINAVTEGMADIPEIDPSIRARLNQMLAEDGLTVLTEELRQLDPVYYDQVDLNNPQRVTRALEVCLGTGKRYSELRKGEAGKRDFNVIRIGLDRPREELYERINMRMDMMLDEGLLEEARALHEFKDHQALQTVGYKEIFGYLEGEYDMEEAVRLLKRNSRRYAKRQMTWFGKDEKIRWFHPDDYEGILHYIKNQIQGQG